MNNEHPITPPSELVQQWWDGTHGAFYEFEAVATQAARWGADQELKECCEALYRRYDIPTCIAPKMAEDMREWLRAARRPKPPSLKEQALAEMELLETEGSHAVCMTTLRRALESLPS